MTVSFERGPGHRSSGRVKTVVDGVSFEIASGHRLGLIGESGSGKTITALSVIGLAPDRATVTGSVRFDGQEMLGRSDRELSKWRGDRVAMVFQNPLTSLNPLMRVGNQIAEPLRQRQKMSRHDALTVAVELCGRVGLPDPRRTVRAYPHQLSGGQRQRVGIAIALACRPALLIADEPTSALDVTVQAEVVALLEELVAELDMALLFITHDLAVVSGLCDQLAVMREGKIVEHGAMAQLIQDPGDPFTRALFDAAARTAVDAPVSGEPFGVSPVRMPG
ncbi:MAG: ABC transporter ATP-binding protein [Ilumatobacteraceae bacterium]